MSLIWMEGFDYYQPGTIPSLNWQGNPSGFSVQPSSARNGAAGLFTANNTGNYLQRSIGSNNGNTMVWGFAVKTPSSYAAISSVGPGFWDGATLQVDVRMDATGKLNLTRNGTILATSTLTVSNNAWHYIELKVKINSIGGLAEVKVDGVVYATFSGNTRTSANNYANLVRLYEINYFISQSFDDLYLLDSTGTLATDYLGDSIVSQTYAIANGGTNNWSNAWAAWAASTVQQVGNQVKDSNGNVQEVTAVTGDAKTGTIAPTWATTGGTTTPDNHVTWTVRGAGANPGAANWMAVSELYYDGDNSYVVDSTPGDIDLYQFGTITSPGGSPNGVQVTAIADKDDAGTRSIRLLAKSGATTVDNGADLPLTQNTYAAYQNVFQTDPNTGAQWTAAGINAARFGVKEIA